MDFPCFVGAVGAWTRRITRGTITGIWATCGNVGNIIGLQLAQLSLQGEQSNNWQRLMYFVFIMYVALAVTIFVAFIAEPREVGIDMQDDHVDIQQPIAINESAADNL